MDTSTLQMALIGYQAEGHKIEEKIAEIQAQLNRRSWRSRQASSSFSKTDLGMRHANLDPDIAALPISRQAKYQKQWKRDGRCTQCGKQRPPDSAMFCPGCRAKHRVKVRERERRLSNAKRRNLGSISYRESGAVT
jgi:rRNA maturation endonuclease Nob1